MEKNPSRAETAAWLIAAVIGVFSLARGAQRVLTALALGSMDPWTVMAGSSVFALLVWIPVAYLGRWVVWRRDLWVRAVPLGLVNIVLAGITLIAAQMYLSAGMVAVLVAGIPLVVALLAAVFLKEKLTRLALAGIACGTVGVAVVTLGRGGVLDAHNLILGLLLTAAGVLSAATVYVGWRGLLAEYPGTVLLGPQLVVSVVVTVPIALVVAGGVAVPAAGVPSLLMLGVINLIVPQLAMFWLLARTTALRSSIASYLAPLVAALLAVPVLGQPLNMIVVLGGVLVIAGAVLVNRGKAKS